MTDGGEGGLGRWWERKEVGEKEEIVQKLY